MGPVAQRIRARGYESLSYIPSLPSFRTITNTKNENSWKNWIQLSTASIVNRIDEKKMTIIQIFLIRCYKFF